MQKQLLALFVTLIVLAVAAVFVLNQAEPSSKTAADTGLLLKNKPVSITAKSLQDIESIKIERGASVLLNAYQEDGLWVSKHLAEYSSFPIQQQNLTTLLRSLAQANIIEEKSANPANYSKLGLVYDAENKRDDLSKTVANGNPGSDASAAVNKENRSATILTVNMPQHSIVLVLGNDSKHVDGQFVRFANDKQSYLIDQKLNTPKNKFEWLSQHLLNIEHEAIQSVSSIASNNQWKISQVDTQDSNEQQSDIINDSDSANNDFLTTLATSFKLDSMPASERLVYDEVLKDYIDNLTLLSYTDAKLIEPASWADKNKSMIIKIETTTDETHSLELVEDENRFYVSIVGQGEYQYLSNWQFEIDPSAAEDLVKRKADFYFTNEDEE